MIKKFRISRDIVIFISNNNINIARVLSSTTITTYNFKARTRWSNFFKISF